MRRAKWGIGAVAVVGVAWLLSTLFNVDLGGLGIGQYAMVPSEGTQTEESTPEEPANTATDSQDVGKVPSDRMVSTANPAASIGADGRVDVRIEDRQYQLRGEESGPKWVPATLEAVVAAAKRAPGDDAGIRVRVLRAPSSRPSAEQALTDALYKAGVRSSELTMPEIEVPRESAE